MSVCPLYQLTGQEMDVARGKLSLIQFMNNNAIKQSSYPAFWRCLLCGACEAICANKVKTTQHIQKTRSQLPESFIQKDFPAKIMTGSGRFSKMIRYSGSLFQGLIAKKIPHTSGLYLRFPLSSLTNRHYIPKLSFPPITHHKNDSTQFDGADDSIGYFVGCGANYMFQETAHGLQTIIKDMGKSFVIPSNQECCGLAAYASGNIKAAIKLAQNNIQAFEQMNVSTLVTTCASCGAHLMNYPSLFPKEGLWHQRALSFVSKYQDAMTFIKTHQNLLPQYSNQQHDHQKCVIFHDPCHMRFGQKKPLSGFDMIASRFKTIPLQACCGNGGLFNLRYFSESTGILDKTIERVQSYKPDFLTTSCIGCHIQFSEGLARHHIDMPVYHPLVLWMRSFYDDINS